MNYKVLAILLGLSCLSTSYAVSQKAQDKDKRPFDIEAYEKKSGCEKQDILWKKIEDSKYENLPDYASHYNVLRMVYQRAKTLSKKINKQTDIAPKGWKKFLHKRGIVAKVKFNATEDHPYTGIFKDADCAILRLSLTYKPGDKPFAPGLAFKALRDGIPSANISALYTLSGQKLNYNFFKNPLSNIVPSGTKSTEKMVHYIFSRVSRYPEELRMNSLAEHNMKGEKAEVAKAPVQIFFVPNPKISFSEKKHDIRKDMLTIKSGTILYTVHAIEKSSKFKDFSSYRIKDIPKHIAASTYIGEIISTSAFIASKFGDTGIFFKHDAE